MRKDPKRLYEMTEKERIKQADDYVVQEAERHRLETSIKKKKKKKLEVCQICGLPKTLCVCHSSSRTGEKG